MSVDETEQCWLVMRSVLTRHSRTGRTQQSNIKELIPKVAPSFRAFKNVFKKSIQAAPLTSHISPYLYLSLRIPSGWISQSARPFPAVTTFTFCYLDLQLFFFYRQEAFGLYCMTELGWLENENERAKPEGLGLSSPSVLAKDKKKTNTLSPSGLRPSSSSSAYAQPSSRSCCSCTWKREN